MREEQQSLLASNVGGVLPAGPGVVSVAGKFEELVQRCAQLESENAVLAYKLRRMRRTIRRLGQDNAFIQRRLREHIRKKEGFSVKTLAALAATATGAPCELEHNHTTQIDGADSQANRRTSTGLTTASSAPLRAPPARTARASPSVPTTTATSNGHIGRTATMKLEPQQASRKSGAGHSSMMPSGDRKMAEK